MVVVMVMEVVIRLGAVRFPGGEIIQINKKSRNLSKRWSRRSDLNRGPSDYESLALPLSYAGTTMADDPGNNIVFLACFDGLVNPQNRQN
jgi:hypothetical protein